MKIKPVLIVDDEKNIRLTLSHTLDSIGMSTQTAVDGKEALERLATGNFGMVLLDLKMPGMDGMEVLRRVKELYPRIRVIIISAHGTIESAVEAMKLGAIDFIQKPFSPAEIRDLVQQVMDRETLDVAGADDYSSLIGICKRHITDRRFEEAREAAKKALAKDPGQPEPYNLLGAFFEFRGHWAEAEKFYRAALEIDPGFRPAKANLDRMSSRQRYRKVELWNEEPAEVKNASEE